MRDVVCSWRQWIIVTSLVTTQVLITFLLPVPGCPLWVSLFNIFTNAIQLFLFMIFFFIEEDMSELVGWKKMIKSVTVLEVQLDLLTSLYSVVIIFTSGQQHKLFMTQPFPLIRKVSYICSVFLRYIIVSIPTFYSIVFLQQGCSVLWLVCFVPFWEQRPPKFCWFSQQTINEFLDGSLGLY